MVTKIVVNLELGHVAKTLDVPTLNGHTHEWVMFVRGAETMEIEYFVEKVVFWLHDSYVPPKVIVKYPPYQVKQSGYAGFNVLIDIHFKNKSEPKSVRFHYDLFLHNENMPPVNHTRVEMLTFTNPAEEFKKRLIKAGGIVKNQETSAKEKKSHKDVRRSEEKHSRSNKEKYDGEKPRHKTHHSDSKSSKLSSAGDGKRRSSVGDEFVQKKKYEEKSSASRTVAESKPKEKVNKVKIKMETASSLNSLFSIDDSIHVKQIKKKEATRHDSRKDKEKRIEPKIKKEVKQEHSEKKIRKQSPVVQKVKPSSKEVKVKRHRSPSSSDESDIIEKTRSILAQSDSDSETSVKKKKKKHSKLDKVKLKKSMKRSKNTPDKIVKQAPPARNPPKDVLSAPERDKTLQSTQKTISKPPKKHRKPSEASVVSEKKTKTPPLPEKIKPNPSEVKLSSNHPQRGSTPTSKKEKHSTFRGSTPQKSVEPPAKEKKSVPIPPPTRVATKEKKVRVSSSESSSSSSSSSSDDELALSPIKDVAVPKHVVSPLSPMSTSSSDAPLSEVPSFNVHSEEQADHLNVSNEEILPAPVDHQLDDSESDREETFPLEDAPTDQMDTSLETSEEKIFEEPEEDKQPPAPVNKNIVLVGVGDTFNYYPHMSDDWFEKLKQLQNLLSLVTDEARLKKISSIVRKTGNFTEDGATMNFDFCSLDRKTIHRLEKHLKATGDK